MIMQTIGTLQEDAEVMAYLRDIAPAKESRAERKIERKMSASEKEEEVRMIRAMKYDEGTKLTLRLYVGWGCLDSLASAAEEIASAISKDYARGESRVLNLAFQGAAYTTHPESAVGWGVRGNRLELKLKGTFAYDEVARIFSSGKETLSYIEYLAGKKQVKFRGKNMTGIEAIRSVNPTIVRYEGQQVQEKQVVASVPEVQKIMKKTTVETVKARVAEREAREKDATLTLLPPTAIAEKILEVEEAVA